MKLSEQLREQIQKSKEGKTGNIPFHLERVREYIDISKNTMYLIGGEEGSGKSTFVQSEFLIEPIIWYLNNGGMTDKLRLSVIHLGMERRQINFTSKWISRLIYENEGRYIPFKKIMGIKLDSDGKPDMMTPEEEQLVEEYMKVLDKWEEDDLLICYEGSKNATGIAMFLEKFAEKHGVLHRKDKTDKSLENILAGSTYTPNHPNHIIVVILDNVHAVDPEQGDDEKTTADKVSRTVRISRDLYGMSPVIVQHLNRNISDIHRQKAGDVKPKSSDFHGTGSTSKYTDIMLAVYDPYRHMSDVSAKEEGYSIYKLQDSRKANYYRTLHILKNSFDSGYLSAPIALHPYTGIMKTLPRKSDITEDIYETVTSGKYFTNKQESIEQQRLEDPQNQNRPTDQL